MAGVCDVSVYTARAKDQAAREEIEGVKFVRFSTGIDRRVLGRLQSAWRRDGEPIEFAPSYYGVYVMRAARTALADNRDVITIFNCSQFAPLVKLLNPRAKIILSMHCDWAAQLDRDFIERGVRKADAVVACSRNVADKIQRRFPEYAERCVTIHNGAEPSEFSPAERETARPAYSKIIYVGRLSPEKGVHVLLEAFRRIVERHPNTRLEIVGGEAVMPRSMLKRLSDDAAVRALERLYECDYARNLRDRAAGMPRAQVSFVGAIPHKEVAARMREADILAQPSLYEAFGMPVVEGMLAGLGVVASRVGGMPELIRDGETGLLVKPGDPDALANALLRLIEDPELTRRLGIAARLQASRSFSWDSSVNALMRCCAAICAGESVASSRPARQATEARPQ